MSETLQPNAGVETTEEAASQGEQQPQTPPEQPVEQTPEEKARETAAKEVSRTDKRIAGLTAKLRAAEARATDLEKRVPKPPERDPSKPMTPEEQEAEIDRRADQRLAQREEEKRAKAFQDECNKIVTAGSKEYGEGETDGFLATLNPMWQMLGGFDPGLVDAAIETGDPHKVLYKLAQDPDEAERIAGLSPARRGAALAKLAVASAANPLNTTPAAPPPPRQSAAPAPIKPLQRGGGNAEPRPDGTQDEYERWYKAELKKRGR